MKKNKTYNDKNISPKIRLNYICSINQPLENVNPLNKLIIDFSEIETILNLNDPDMTKVLYFNKSNIHRILYESEEIIDISPKRKEQNLNYYFYLSLLISDNPCIINYNYNYNLIEELNHANIVINSKFKKIIYSKLIIELINNYKEFNDEIDKNENKNLDEIKHYNLNIIKDSIFNLKECNFNINEKELLLRNIDIIYIDLIRGIIKNNKMDNYEYILDIMNQLDLENIDLTKNMFNGITEILNMKNKYINKKMINNINDILCEDKINFYYILLKYILKNSIYIYQIPFLIKTKYNIIKILKIKNNFENIIINEKAYYIIKTISDSNYYLEFLKGKTKNDLNENKNNKSDKDIRSEKTDKDILYEKNMNNQIKTINNITTQTTMHETKEKNKNISSQIEHLSENKDNKIVLNKRNDIIKNIEQIIKNYSVNYSTCNKNRNEKKNIIDYKDLIQLTINIEDFDNNFIYFINCQNFIDFIKEFNDIIKSEFDNNLDIEIELNFNEDKKNKNSNNIYNITCEYYYKALDSNYRDENILINGLNQGFEALLCDIKYGNME